MKPAGSKLADEQGETIKTPSTALDKELAENSVSDKQKGQPAAPKQGMGMAMRMGTEMVVATLIGLGMGYYLDQWLETHPWMTLLFFLFGSAAGFRNMYRIVNQDSVEHA